MKKVLVTGGAGFIGSNLANQLADNPEYEVTVIDDLSLGRKSNLGPKVKFVQGDLNDQSVIDGLDQNFDYIIHLAAASSAPMFETDFVHSCETNMIAYLRLLEFARKTKVKKILFASTSSIYGDDDPPLREDMPVMPPNIYAATKHNMEEISRVYADLYNMEIIAFRFMSIYGLHEEHKGKFANLVSQFIWTMYQGQQPVLFGDGLQTRDFTNVRDVASAIILGMETDKKYGFTVFNIGSAANYNLIDLVDKINHSLKTQIEPRFIASPLKWTARNQLGDLTKIRTELGFEPKVSLDEGIIEIVSHLPTNSQDVPDVSQIEKIIKK